MAAVDLARRSEIGREKRARTRERLLAAASAALGSSGRDSVTVDEIVAAAGVAKGTFYVHFEDVEALWAELAERLTREFDELLQPRRLALNTPLARVAYGCAAFLEKGRREANWATLAARAALRRPEFGAGARTRLEEDLGFALVSAPVVGLTPVLASEMVAAIVLRIAPRLAGGSPEAVEAAVAAILRTVGQDPAAAAALAVEAITYAQADIEAHEADARRTA